LKSNPNPWIYYSIGAVKKFTAPKLNPLRPILWVNRD
jgi:hypothetical protein